MSHGGKRKGAGRPKGSTNKLTAEQVEAVQQGQSPLEYLLSVMRDREREDKDRIDAAKAAAPFVHAKLSSVEMNARVGFDHESALDELEGETDTEET
ncbi:MAG: hypothetical protein GWN30_20645 [Gammaproteobacteria bacterium]|nr:hypothetical protein [Gammaproteobacteria bacterium]NIX00627.1 hypothetical protein [Phycisphaerae bacterium]